MQDFADTIMWPERRITEEDVKRMREAEGIDAGDYGHGAKTRTMTAGS